MADEIKKEDGKVILTEAKFDELLKNAEVNKDLRDLFDEYDPILEKFDKNPELKRLLESDKLDESTVKLILDGKVKPEEATAVAAATDKVKEEIGQEAFDKATPEQIEKLVKKELEGVKSVVKSEIDESLKGLKNVVEEIRTRTEKDDLEGFIAKHPDIRTDSELNERIASYLDDHPNANYRDVYYSEKGKLVTEREASKGADQRARDGKTGQFGESGSSRTGEGRPDPNDVSQFVRLKPSFNHIGPRE